MRRGMTLLVCSILLTSGAVVAAEKAIVKPAEPQPAPQCWDPQVKRCCSVAAVPAAVSCSQDGFTWTCAPVINSNPLILTLVSSELGFEGKENDGTADCKYTKRLCGGSPLTCLNGLQETATCQKEKSSGDLCSSQP